MMPHQWLLAGLVGLWCAGAGLAAGPTTAFERRHAEDRVAWQFWSPEAVAAARTAERPVLLSIGFEGCPGCELMSRESFGDDAVAQLMNERFTCLLLDAEAWPAAARQYAALAEALGVPPIYPLNLFLTPDLRPFAAVGYLPPQPTATAPGWAATVARVAEQYDPAQAGAAGQVLLADVAARLDTTAAPSALPETVRDAAVAALREAYDPEYGGFGSRAKRLPLGELVFLLRESVARTDSLLRRMVTQTIDRLAASPTWDQLSGGLFRGSADRAWQIPTLEKSLVDNARLVPLLLDVERLTGESRYRHLAEQTLDYLRTELLGPDGHLAAGQRGGLEVWGWSHAEAAEVLGEAAAAVDWPVSAAVPGPLTLPTSAREALRLARQNARQAARLPEAPPAARALAITAFALAAQRWGRPEDLALAVQLASQDAPVTHPEAVSVAPDTAAPASSGQPLGLTDLALLAASDLDLWETDFAPRWLDQATARVAEAERRLGGDPNRPFTEQAPGPAGPPVAEVRAVDSDLPAGNAVLAEVLLRLGRLREDLTLRQRAETVIESFAQAAAAAPAAHLTLLGAARYLAPELPGVAILGPPEHAAPLLEATRAMYLPERVVAWLDPTAADAGEVEQAVALFENREAGATARAYVCTLTGCLRPVDDPARLTRLLEQQSRPRRALGG